MAIIDPRHAAKQLVYEKSFKAAPLAAEQHLIKAKAAQKRGDGDTETQEVGRAVALDPADTRAHLGLADACEKQGDLKIAASNVYNRKILELTRLDQQLEVFETVMDAVKSYQ